MKDNGQSKSKLHKLLMMGLALASTTALANEPIAELTPAEVFRVAAPSVVVVEGVDGAGHAILQGSGVVFSTDAVVTNCHVLKGAVAARVIHKGRKLAARIRHGDPPRDLCSFSVPGLNAPVVAIGSSRRATVGSPVYAIGAPQGLALSLSDGLIASFRGEGDIAGVLQITAPISPGSSGGGLFDSSGSLIGITTLYLEGSQQINFAVPVEWIAELPIRREKYLASAHRVRIPLEPDTPYQPPETQSRWTAVGQDSQASAYLDLSSARVDGGRVRVWAITKFVNPVNQGRLIGIRRVVSSDTYDCDARTVSVTSAIVYDKEGRILGTVPPKDLLGAREVVPGSLGNLRWSAACALLAAP